MPSASTTPLIGFGALGASLLFGYIWTHASPSSGVLHGAGFALAATALLYLTFSSDVATAGKDSPGSIQQ